MKNKKGKPTQARTLNEKVRLPSANKKERRGEGYSQYIRTKPNPSISTCGFWQVIIATNQ
ncbi:MAG: hypothetical protein L0Z71_05780 [Anaerolineae bacterium]|nr:hypothetical protein [Anaerolineae bacterium]